MRSADGAAARTSERYWDVPAPGRSGAQRRGAGSRECRRRLEETVRMRLMSDVPLGMFLSGGVDSSAIAALMKRMVSGPVKTFSVGYREERVQRTRLRAAGGRRHRHRAPRSRGRRCDDFFDALPRLIWHEDEPITWPSSVSLYFVSRLAARAREGGADRRGQRRVVRRLRPLPLLPARTGAGRDATACCRRALRRRDARLDWRPRPALGATLRRKLQHTFLGCGDESGIALSRQLLLARFRPRSSERAAGRSAGAMRRTPISCSYWNGGPDATACSAGCSTRTRRRTWSNCS